MCVPGILFAAWAEAVAARAMSEVVVDRAELVVDAVPGVRIERRQESVRFATLVEIEMSVMADIVGNFERGHVRIVTARIRLERDAGPDGEIPLLADFLRERLVRLVHGWICAIVRRQDVIRVGNTARARRLDVNIFVVVDRRKAVCGVVRVSLALDLRVGRRSTGQIGRKGLSASRQLKSARHTPGALSRRARNS